jgi:hypothetical protein
MREFIKNMLTDEMGGMSSKRTVGVLAALSLITSLLVNVFSCNEVSDVLIYSVLTLAVSALGLTAIDKYTKHKNK